MSADRQEAQRMMTTPWLGLITCPVCNRRDEETGDYPPGLRHDGDRAMWCCGYCGAECEVTVSVSYEFRTRLIVPGATPDREEAR